MQAKLSRRFAEKAELFFCEIKDIKTLKELEDLMPSTCQVKGPWEVSITQEGS